MGRFIAEVYGKVSADHPTNLCKKICQNPGLNPHHTMPKKQSSSFHIRSSEHLGTLSVRIFPV